MGDTTTGQPNTQPPGQSSAPPAAPPPAAAAGTTLFSATTEQLRDLYNRTPELFKNVLPAPPPAPPASPPPPPAGSEDLKLELPQGANVDPKVIDRFKEVWKSASPEKRAQAAVDFYLKLNEEAHAANKASFDAYWKANEEGLRADPDFKEFEKASAVAQRPLAKYGTAEEAKRMLEKGYAKDADFLRLMRRIGHAMGEDSTRRPPPVSQEIQDEQRRLLQRYDNPTSRDMSGMPPREPNA